MWSNRIYENNIQEWYANRKQNHIELKYHLFI